MERVKVETHEVRVEVAGVCAVRRTVRDRA